MSERDDQSIDHELAGIAMAASHEHERTVSANEAGAALNAVRSRIAAGDLGGAPPSIPSGSSTAQRRSPWVRFGAVAAVVAMVALGLVAVVGSDRSNDVLTPATVPIGENDPTIPATDPSPTTETTLDSESQTPTTSPRAAPEGQPPSTTASDEFVEQTISVDAADPPPVVEPTVWQTVPIDPANEERAISVAVAADSVIVKQNGVQAVSILGPGPDSQRTLELAEDLSFITSGPTPVIYGIGDAVFADDDPAVPDAFRFVGIATNGPDAGDVVASSEIDVNRYLELPDDPFGRGADGVIDRVRDIGATMIDYVDENGEPIAENADGALVDDHPVTIPRFDDVDGDGRGDVGGRIVTPSNDRTWMLDITRDPRNGSTFVGPTAPRPTTGDRVIYFERIGANDGIDEFAQSALPVVAILDPDGSGEWVRLPDDWNVIASDVTGTVLVRTTGTDFEFAFLDEALADAGFDRPASPPIDPSPSTDEQPTTTTSVDRKVVQPRAIERSCAAEFRCTSIAQAETGSLVTLDPRGTALTVHDAEGVEVQERVDLVEPLDGRNPRLVDVGPDAVAYVLADDPDVEDPVGVLLAIPLEGEPAGSVVMSWSGVSRVGDSSLVPRRAGLTVVPCCGPLDGVRPDPDATLYRWVDRSGQAVESNEPSFDLVLGGESGDSLVRIDTADDGSAAFTSFPLPTALRAPRDFPRVVATDDGGALATDFVQSRSGGAQVIVRFRPDWADSGLDNGDVYYQDVAGGSSPALLEQRGTVLVAAEDAFVRRSVEEVADAGWAGDRVTAIEDDNALQLRGFNQFIDAEQPTWAVVPDLFAFQIVPELNAGETVTFDFELDADAPTIVITVSGALDDSVAAVQTVVETTRADDGLLRYVSGGVTYRCQPGRGQQEFAPDVCI